MEIHMLKVGQNLLTTVHHNVWVQQKRGSTLGSRENQKFLGNQNWRAEET